jgi:protein tyrosine/serine phosphatase
VKKIFRASIVIAVFLAFSAASCFAAPRDPKWAAPLEMEGAPNLHKVTDNIFRSAQPTRAGFKNLESMGIRTVVNLREWHGDELRKTSLKEVRIKMRTWEPEIEDLVRAVQILSDESGGPYLVHCQHGADRTGMVIAAYRMAVQGWSRENAIEEMTDGGYGFHSIWTEIPEFLRQVDIESVKSRIKHKTTK